MNFQVMFRALYARGTTLSLSKLIIFALTLGLVSPIVSLQFATANVTSRPSAPAQPSGNSSTTGVVVTSSPNGLTVSWGAPLRNASQVTGYQVEYSTNGSTWTVATDSLSSATFSHTISSLNSNTPYYVRVAAKTSSGLGAYGYPWTLAYEVTRAFRNSDGTIFYRVNNSSTLGTSNSNFTRVRYEMTKTDTSNDTKRVYADFEKTLSNSLTACSGGSCTPSNLNSIGNLQVPAPVTGANIFVGGEVQDLSVYSDDTTRVTNGHGFVGRVELFPRNYGIELPASYNSSQTGIAAGSGSIYDFADTPNVSGDYGSFQIHNVTSGNTQTVFAWNRHSTSSTYEIGFGSYNRANTNVGSDWTFCRANGVCVSIETFNLKILANIPTYAGCAPSASTTSVTGYTVLTFTASGTCTWTVPNNVIAADVLAVGGGGGGGADGGSGGGGGELRYATSYTVTPSSNLDITLGSGGSGGAYGGSAPTAGSSTLIISSSSNTTLFEAKGGKPGRGWNDQTAIPGGTGGSGGTGTNGQNGGLGPARDCVVGSSPAGSAPSNSITGSAISYGGGGGGGSGFQLNNAGNSILGAAGGGTNSGGRGASYKIGRDGTATAGASRGSNGFANSGGGGGAGSACDAYAAMNSTFASNVVIDGVSYSQGQVVDGRAQRTQGGSGGSGVVIIRYVAPPSITLTNGTVSAFFGTAVTSYSVSNTGGPATYSVSPALPTGISLNSSTGLISGTATAVQAPTTHTLTATNANGTSTATFTLRSTYAACSPTSSTVEGHTLLRFTTVGNCSWSVPSSVTNVEILVVAGGGGGGGYYWAGGGGGGGIMHAPSQTVATSDYFEIGVGDGGAGGSASNQSSSKGSTGGNSFINLTVSGARKTYTARGGGGGGGYGWGAGISVGTGVTGGSAGGHGEMPSGSGTIARTAGTQSSSDAFTGYANSGGSMYGSGSQAGSGGGGAGGAGGNVTAYRGPGAGGPGRTFTITGGSGTTYAGGGGGASVTGAAGGSGGGGAGASDNAAGGNGSTNTGGGGGGSMSYKVGGKGGSGIVLVRYVNAPSISLSNSTINASLGVELSGYSLTNSGGPATFSITPSLPAGLSLNTSTGAVTGTPTSLSSSTTYTLTATNTTGTSSLTFTLAVAITTCSPTVSSSGGYRILKFTTVGVCNWTVPAGVTSYEVAVVGGGGGGGFGNLGGGGGAGEVQLTNEPISTTPGRRIEIKIGAGGLTGAPTGATATDSKFTTSNPGTGGGNGESSYFGTVIANGGGGGGGSSRRAGANGGSGGGGSQSTAGGSKGVRSYTGWTSYAFDARFGLSGGGAGGAGAGGTSVLNTSNGGPGITALGVEVAGGGGGWPDGLGGKLSGSDRVLGGNARIGTGSFPYRSTVVSGQTVYTSEGVNGTGSGGGAGAPGGSGVVIVRYTCNSGVVQSSLLIHLDAGNDCSSTGSTTTWTDISANTNNLTLNNTPTYASTKGKFYSFGSGNKNSSDTSGQYGNFPAISSSFASGFTISFFARFPTTGGVWERIIDFGNGQANNNILVGRSGSSSELILQVYTGGTVFPVDCVTNTNAIVGNEWAHFAITANPTDGCKIYKNGELIRTISNFTTMPNAVNRTLNYVARSNWGADRYFSGSIGDLALYNRALTSTEISTNYQAQAEYSVTYDANNATTGTAPTDSSTGYLNGAQVTVLANTGNLVRTGYTFGGWNTASGGTGTTYAASGSATFNMAFADVILYAKWDGNQYTYNANGGSGTTASQTFAGSALTARTNGFTPPTGYIFGGWCTTQQALGTSCPSANAYAAGANLPTPTTSVTLYASWLATISITVPASISAPAASTSYSITGITVANVDSTKTYLVSIGLSGVGNSGALLKMGTTTNLTPSFGYTDTNSNSGNDLRGGFTNISFTVSGANLAQLNTNLNSLTYVSGDGSGTPSITITVTENSIDGIAFNPANGHYYLARTGGSFAGLTWTQANTQAKAVTYLGQPGYLVTITSAAEMSFVASRISGATNIWIGASDADTEGLWKWATDGGSPEAGKRFWRAWCVDATTLVSNCSNTTQYGASSGLNTGSNVTADGINYSNWATNEPNNYFNSTGEDYAVANWNSGVGWNDLQDSNTGSVNGYVIEFGTNNPGNGFVTGTTSATSTPITVQTRPVISYSGSPFTYLRGTTITPIAPTNTGGTATSYAISPNLPAGLNINTTTGQITGTPTETSTATTYTITATGSGSTGTTTISITVNLPPVAYEVSFAAGGGSGSMTTLTGTASSVALTSNSFTRNGYTFAGWRDAANTSYSNGQTLILISATTLVLTAQWTANSYSISYTNTNTSNGASAPTDSKNYTISETATVLGNPTNLQRTGYTFAGWVLSTDLNGTVYTSGTTYTMPAGNVTFVPKWNANTYTITYNKNGASGNPERDSDTYTSGGQSITLPTIGNMTRTGFDFGGWSATPTGSSVGSPYTTSENVTLYAIWNIKTITVTYSTGTPPTTSDFTYFPTTSSGTFNSSIVLPTPDSTTVTVNTNTYQFLGWTDGVTSYPAGASYRLPANNVTLTATWALLLQVNYVLNGGTFPNSRTSTFDSECPSNSGYRCSESQEIALDEAPSRPGFNFTGWRNGSGVLAQATESQTVTSNSYIFQAQWSAIPRVVQYEAAGGSTTPGSSTLFISDTFTVAAAITRNGYSFAGWNDGSLTYGPGSTYTIGITNVTLTAQWTPDVYTVTYDLNGGQGNVRFSDTFTVGTDISLNLPASGGARDGYNFAGWSTSQSANSGFTTYTPTANITLYAVWTQGSFTVTKNQNWSAGQQIAASVSQGNPVVLGKPERANFVFTGWFDAPSNGNFINDGVASYTPNRSRTLYAQWVQKSLFGISPASLFRISTQRFQSGISTSFTASNAVSSVNVVAPADALPNETELRIDLVGDFTRARNLIDPDHSYVVSAVISWLAPGDLVPDTVAGKPITVTLTNAAIKKGATIYKMLGDSATVLGVATQDGSVTVQITTDPEILVAITEPNAPTGVTATTGEDTKSTVSWSAPEINGGESITGYIVVASGSGGQGCQTNGALTCEVTGLVNDTQYTFTVKAKNSIGDSVASTPSSAITPRAPGAQIVTWSPTTSLVMTQTPHTPSSLATSEGGGTISYSVLDAGATGCSVNSLSAVLTFTAPGSCAVRATAPSVGNFLSESITVTFNISLAPRTLTIDDSSYESGYFISNAAPTLTATASAGTGSVAFTSVTTPICTIDSTSGDVTFVAIGICRISASIPPAGSYDSATATTISFEISEFVKATQTITWSPATTIGMNQSPFTPSALALSSGTGAITYTVVDAGSTGCTVNLTSGVITFTAAGECSIKATAGSNADYFEENKTVAFTIAKLTQTVTWAPGTALRTDQTPHVPSAEATTNGTGGITYSVVDAGTTGCTINALTGLLTYITSGNCQVKATASSDTTYAEGIKTVTFVITKLVQTVTWAPNVSLLSTQSPHTPTALATTDGTGGITYSVVNDGGSGCVINSTTGVLTFNSAGNCQVKATAASNNVYLEGSKTVTYLIARPPFAGADGVNSTAQVALYFKVVSADNENVISKVPTCVSLFTRDASPQFIGTACTLIDGNINMLAGAGKVAIYVFEQANQSEKRMYLGEISKESFQVEGTNYFPGTTRWVVAAPKKSDVTPTPSPTPKPTTSTSPTPTPSPSTSPSVSPTPSASPSPTSPTPTPSASPTPKPTATATPKPTLPNDLSPVQNAFELNPGEFSTLLNGKVISASIKPTQDRNGLEISGKGWSLTIQALDTKNKPLPLPANGVLDFRVNGKVRITGEGALPNSELRAYLLANVTLLESRISAKNGRYTINMLLPQAITPGTHVLQVNTQVAGKQIRSLSIGLNVNAAQPVSPTPTTSPRPSVSPTPKPTPTIDAKVSTSIVPFRSRSARVEATQLSVIRKLKLTGNNVEVLVTGYTRNTNSRDDLRLSLDRALEVRKAIARIAPKAKVTILGAGSKVAPECRAVQNQCVTIQVKR